MANLLQIQDDLKSLPNDPRTMQMLASYANGANPLVPPYLALGELNRRKQLMEKKQMEMAGQPPQGTVKDQVEQQAGLMALQQQRMQAMPPQGMPQQGMPSQGMPQQAMPPVGAAGGGLLDLIAAKANVPRMNSGGIIAFAKSGVAKSGEAEDDDEVADDEDTDATATDVSVSPDEAFAEAVAGRKMAERFVNEVKAPKAESPMEFRKRMIRENPEKYGYLETDEGPEILSRMDELQAAKRAELAKQREESERLKPGVLQLLAQQAMQTGGMGGRQALARMLGGYSQAQMGAEAKAIEREQGIRAQEIKLQEDKMTLVNKVQELKRARDEGDIKAEQKALMDLAKLAKDHNTTVGNLIGKVVSSTSGLAGRIGAAEIGRKGRVESAEIARKGRVEAARVSGAGDKLSERERVAAKAERISIGKETFNGETGPEAADKYIESIAKSGAAIGGARYTGPDRTFEREVKLHQLYANDEVLKEHTRNLSMYIAAPPSKENTARIERLQAAIDARKKELAATVPTVPGKPGTTPPAAGDKVMTMADVRATAQKHGKTEAEVIAAAKARGFTINP